MANVSSPGDKDLQKRFLASPTEYSAPSRSSSGLHSVGLARNRCLHRHCHQEINSFLQTSAVLLCQTSAALRLYQANGLVLLYCCSGLRDFGCLILLFQTSGLVLLYCCNRVMDNYWCSAVPFYGTVAVVNYTILVDSSSIRLYHTSVLLL